MITKFFRFTLRRWFGIIKYQPIPMTAPMSRDEYLISRGIKMGITRVKRGNKWLKTHY